MSELKTGRAWLRGLSRAESDPYEDGDIANAQRVGALLWIVLAALIVAILPLSPPDMELGGGGWLLAAVTVGFMTAWIALLRSESTHVSWSAQLLAGYLGVAAIALLQWTSGGIDAPFSPLLLLLVLYVAVLHPPERVVLFMLAVTAALLAPLLYADSDGADHGEVLITFVIWSGIAFLGTALMGILRDQRRSLRLAAAEAKEEAREDSLTGLPNRRAFDESLETEIQRVRRLGIPLTVVMIDIANFKRINDIWGTSQGDVTLRTFGEALRKEIRRPDVVFRWGGDEFALILTGADAEGARDAAERLRASIARDVKAPDKVPLAIRFGSAELRDQAEADDLIEDVGLSLSAAKAKLTTEDARTLFAAAKARVSKPRGR